MGDSHIIYDDAAPAELKIAAAQSNYEAIRQFEQQPDYRHEDHLSAGTRRYVGADYAIINAYLNNPAVESEPYGLQSGEIREIIAEILRDMRPLSRDMVVFRGVHSVRNPNAFAAGKYIDSRAFTSMSVSREVGAIFSRGDYLIEMQIPKGTPTIVTNRLECEVILPPGALINFTRQYFGVQFPYIEMGTGKLTYASVQCVLLGNVGMGGQDDR